MLIRWAFAAAVALAPLGAAAGAAAGAEVPRRVVSINLCTDQLAMALAAPGQLLSVSALAHDPRTSLMAEQAGDFPANHGRAEEIYLMRPDLVLASTFTTPATLSMLRRLNVPVVTFEPEVSLDGITASILQMGDALGRADQAAAMARDFRRDLAALRRAAGDDAPVAATWAANGYMTGTRTLSSDVLRAAGFSLLAERLGLEVGAMIPLELLLMADPDAVVGGPGPGPPPPAAPPGAHPPPARSGAERIEVDDREWICGLPAVLDLARELGSTRARLSGQTGEPSR